MLTRFSHLTSGEKPPQEASPSPSKGGDVFPTTCLLKFKVQNYDYFSIAGVTMIVINTLACTLITRYLLYALVWKRTSPPLEGLGGRLFLGGFLGGGFFSPVHLLPIISMKSGFFEDQKPQREKKNTPWRGFYNLTLPLLFVCKTV